MINFKTLNDFEKKTMLNALNKFNIINMPFFLDHHNRVFYIYYFKIEDFIFTQVINYSSNILREDKIESSVFFENSKIKIEKSIGKIHDYLLSDTKVPESSVNSVAEVIYWMVQYNYTNYYSSGIVNESPDVSHRILITNRIKLLLSNGCTMRETFSAIYESLGLYGSNIEELVLNAEDIDCVKDLKVI